MQEQETLTSTHGNGHQRVNGGRILSENVSISDNDHQPRAAPAIEPFSKRVTFFRLTIAFVVDDYEI